MMYLSKRSRGYTLIEMIVSVGIFSIVMLLATGAYLTLISLDRKTRAQNDVVNSLSFAVDSMSRALRTGNSYICGSTDGTMSGSTDGLGNCPFGNSSISFTDEQGRLIIYRTTSNNGIGRCVGTPCGPANAVPLTEEPPRITINSFTFYVQGAGPSSGETPPRQPRVVFRIKGTINSGTGSAQAFDIQSQATQRLIEI